MSEANIAITGDNVTDRRSTLESDLRGLRERYNTRTRTVRTFLLIGVVLCIGSPIAYFALDSVMVGISMFAYGSPFLMLPVIRPSSELALQIRDVENELDLLGIADTSVEQRAEKLFKLHQFELKRYYSLGVG